METDKMNGFVDTMKFVCPICKQSLSEYETGYFCDSCSIQWPVEHDVQKFSRYEVPYSVFDSEIAGQVTEVAETEGWSSAIEKFSNTIGNYTLNYIQNESRADWHILLPINHKSSVLDIGSGWGNIAISIARRCKKVYCCDVNMGNLRLLNARIRETGLNNIETFLYDPNRFLSLPFPDQSVDVVLLNGVLEWMGNIDHPSSPKKIQVEALKEINRVLKPSGVLYIGIENRYSMSSLRGVRLHGELPFVGLLPRWLSNMITKLVRGESHRTYIYTLFGYRRIIRKAGFKTVNFFWPYPSYHDPNYLIPLKPGWVKRFWLDAVMVSRSKKFRLVRAFKLNYFPFHWLAYSYGIRCHKG